MLHIGSHLSIAKGWTRMGEDALRIQADTFQFFTRNPRGSKAKAINEADMAGLVRILGENAFVAPLGHAPYIMNACAADPQLRELAASMMREDLRMLSRFLPGSLYNFHPGSHVGQGVDTGIRLITEMLNSVLGPNPTDLADSRELPVTVLLETMAGQGSEIGSSFEELGRIIEGVEQVCGEKKIGVCLDTCHVYCAGYDIVDDLDGVLADFDQAIGLERLRAVHLNDSLNPLGSRKDRHARIGEGNIGWDALSALINHPALRNLPFYLETPNELPGYADEIRRLREAWREC